MVNLVQTVMLTQRAPCSLEKNRLTQVDDTLMVVVGGASPFVGTTALMSFSDTQ